MAPVRPAPETGPSVAVLGRIEHPSTAVADEVRAAEANDVAATVVRAIGEEWAVDDGQPPVATGPSR